MNKRLWFSALCLTRHPVRVHCDISSVCARDIPELFNCQWSFSCHGVLDPVTVLVIVWGDPAIEYCEVYEAKLTSFPKINRKGKVAKCSLSEGILLSKPDKNYNVVCKRIVIQTVHRRLDFLTSIRVVTMTCKTSSNYGLSNWNFLAISVRTLARHIVNHSACRH